MDPDANLTEQVALANHILEAADSPDPEALSHALWDDGERLAELVLSLDTWIKSGGYLPLCWSNRR